MTGRMTLAALALFACSFVPLAFSAESQSEIIKRNMSSRKPKLDELKKASLIGENSKGLLEVLAGKTLAADSRKIVDEENADRSKVYSAIAKQQKTTSELVGKRRAIKICEKAKPGEYIQSADGKWAARKAE